MEESEKPEKLKRCLQKDTAGPVPARALECCLDAERNGKHRGVTLGNTFRRVGRNVLKWLSNWLATIFSATLLSSCVRLTFLSRVRRSSICILAFASSRAGWSAGLIGWDLWCTIKLGFLVQQYWEMKGRPTPWTLLRQIEIMTRAGLPNALNAPPLVIGSLVLW